MNANSFHYLHRTMLANHCVNIQKLSQVCSVLGCALHLSTFSQNWCSEESFYQRIRPIFGMRICANEDRQRSLPRVATVGNSPARNVAATIDRKVYSALAVFFLLLLLDNKEKYTRTKQTQRRSEQRYCSIEWNLE